MLYLCMTAGVGSVVPGVLTWDQLVHCTGYSCLLESSGQHMSLLFWAVDADTSRLMLQTI